MASATTEIMWIQSLLSELKIKSDIKPVLWCDNKSTIYMSANPVLHSRTKHIEIDIYFVRELILKGQLLVNHISGTYQRANILTEALTVRNFIRFKGSEGEGCPQS